jgi:hypothetical protein
MLPFSNTGFSVYEAGPKRVTFGTYSLGSA